ncbi:MAG: putative dsRNA-binding protein, partial [Geobacter sp.]
DGGFAAVQSVVHEIYTPLLGQAMTDAPFNDPKSELQEWLAVRHRAVPTYELIAEDGPAHDRCFTVSVILHGERIATGEGRSKKAAQQAAARVALQQLQGR